MAHPPDTRPEPPQTGTEAEVLLGFLEFHRATLLWKTDGLTDAQLRTPLAPSTLTLVSLMKHLAYVEDWWCGQVLAGREPHEPWASADWEADHDWELTTALTDPPAAVRALLEREIATSRAIVAEALAGPDGLAAYAPRPGGDPRPGFSLRWILVHLVEEYARHNGHADLIRQSLDGQVGE